MGGDDVCVVDVGVRGRRCVLGGRGGGGGGGGGGRGQATEERR